MKLIMWIFCCTFYDSVFSKRHESRSMKEKERVEYLKKSSKKVVKQYGPDYYRKVKPLIHRKNCNWCTGFNIGRLDA